MNTDGTNSSSVVWGLAILAGVLAFLAIHFLADYTFWTALLLAILIGILVGILLWVGIYRDADDGPDAVAEQAATASPPAAAPAKAATTPATTAKPKAAPKPKTPTKPAIAKDGKPPTLAGPRDGVADDLKQLKGVGPALEKTLNELGFYHFDQVAGWRKKEIEWVDARLRFKGRIVRDGWVKQAKTLATGGATEFSKRVKKGDVY